MTQNQGVTASPPGHSAEPEPQEGLGHTASVPNAEFVPPPLADELPIVLKLERGVEALSVGDIWQAAGVIKALYSALSENVPEVAALAHCCHTLDQKEIWEVVHRGDLALEAARR